MTAKEIRETLEKQLQLLSERSQNEKNVDWLSVNENLSALTNSMCEVVKLLIRFLED